MVSESIFSLAGKIAIVTGGKRGIGKAIALAFAQAGADVVVCSRVLEDGQLQAVAGEIKGLGRRSLAIQADISRRADVDNLVQQVIDEFGRIDILVNSAAIGNIGGKKVPWLIDLPEDNWDLMMDIDLKGCYLCCQAVGREMVERKQGNIINISSVDAFRGRADPYAIAKAGINRLTRGLARDLGPYNIRVNAIVPAWVKTDAGVVLTEEQHAAFSEPEKLKQLKTRIPLGRIAQPGEIANVAIFLASEASSYITGEIITVDGGLSLGF